MITNDWKDILDIEFNKDYFINLNKFLDIEYKNKNIYPNRDNIFNAFNYCSYNNCKVVILGQDPYHGIGQANGLAFSVNSNIKIPPSLRNIYKELKDDLNITLNDGDLSHIARQGVLLLNTSLTVEEGKANSHSKIGWEIFTNEVIKILNNKCEPIVFVLWGNNAIKKEELITNNIHYIIKSVHPSPLSASRGFFGSKPFSKINKFLIDNYNTTIDFNK